jgi:HD-GYP domain-containing protein (c-di-GMP phosphodiesterase class II)
MGIQADLRHVIYALSDALDLVGVDDVFHGKRVGIMAAECARAEGRPEDEVAFLFDLGMLHDLGVSSTQAHRSVIDELDWPGAQEHCETGHRLLKDFAPLSRMALPVRHHHTRWDRLVESSVETAVARLANRVFLVDRVDAFSRRYQAEGTLLLHTDEVREQVRRHAGSHFAPDLVDVFLEASRAEAFWLLLETHPIEGYVQDRLMQGHSYAATHEDLQQLAHIFSRIVDAKSPFTARHSLGVARLSRFIAERMGIGGEACDKLEIAGLLHDLGKLRVPDDILDKPGRLEPEERLIIDEHSLQTFKILHRIPGFEEIARWAACHHVEPGRTAYPILHRGETPPPEARILRVADIFQAMVQDRPYRKGLDEAEVLAFMGGLAAQGRIEGEILEVAVGAMPEAMAAARAGDAGRARA